MQQHPGGEDPARDTQTTSPEPVAEPLAQHADEPAPEAEGAAPATLWAAPGLPHKRHVPGAAGLIYAGVVPRAIAWGVDVILIGFVSFVALAVLIALIVGTPDSSDAVLSTIVWIGIAVAAAVYFIGFWTGRRRATLGMRLFRLQIGFVATGEPLTARQAALRVAALGIPLWPLVAIPAVTVVSLFALFVWPILLLISTALSPRRRGLHDRAAWSAVVMPGRTPPT
jgi:uncharacterized RDD family membrane protein YckC